MAFWEIQDRLDRLKKLCDDRKSHQSFVKKCFQDKKEMQTLIDEDKGSLSCAEKGEYFHKIWETREEIKKTKLQIANSDREIHELSNFLKRMYGTEIRLICVLDRQERG
jgi:hypothetical protein